MKRIAAAIVCLAMALGAPAVAENLIIEAVQNEGQFAGEELSILVSTGWMDSRFDETIARFEAAYHVSVDVEEVPADLYMDVLQADLANGLCADIFWMQSNPFAIESVIVDPEGTCIDFTGAEWQNVMPVARQASCMVGDKLYGLQLWHNSPEYVLVYNKTLFGELGIDHLPTTYEELLDVCAVIAEAGIIPWFVPGLDGWQHQLAFFQIGGVYEEAAPGLYEALNSNEATFADNEKMLEVLAQFKELSDLGYFGENWMTTDSTNMAHKYADRTIAFAMNNSGYVRQIQEVTDTSDEYGMFLIPLGDNSWYPTNPAGPTMFGYKGNGHEDLVRAFFQFVCTPQSLQEIVDNAPNYTNLDVNVEIDQYWLPEEEEFMLSVDPDRMGVSVLQTGTKYTNDYWMEFGQDLLAYARGEIEANDVLRNMDKNRASAAAMVGDEAWR